MATKLTPRGIEYTKGDTFKLTVSSKKGFVFDDTLKFIISKSEKELPSIENTYCLSDNVFVITLSDNDKQKLELGEYLFKIIVISSHGTIITKKSGEFMVKWGA